MQRKLMDILACPIDKHYPLELLVFDENEQTVAEGVILCSECGRYYPIIGEIPVMLPDNLRSRKEDLEFLKKWETKLPEKVAQGGLPWNLKSG
jgi:uncharacterized protein YbaR (Trm112 family)